MEIFFRDADGINLGSGPLWTATSWESTSALDRAGAWQCEFPATDPAGTLAAIGVYAYCYAPVGGTIGCLGGGVIARVEKRWTPEGIVAVMEGEDLLQELTYTSAGTLSILDTEVQNPVKVTLDYDDGGLWYTADLTTLYDNGTSTYTISALEDDQYVYIGGSTPLSGFIWTVGDDVNLTAATLTVQYWDGAQWLDTTNVVDGTAVDGQTMRQSGTCTWDRPNNHTLYVHADTEAYWVRLQPSVTLDSMTPQEVDVLADCPSEDGLATVIALDGDWSLDTTNGQEATGTAVYHHFAGENVLAALVRLADLTGEHFRLGTGREIVWLGKTTPESGCYLVPADVGGGVARVDDPSRCLIETLSRREDAYELATRVYPYGTGQGKDRLTLAASTASPASGYTKNATLNYVQSTAGTAAYGVRERVLDFPDVGPIAEGDMHLEEGANALLLAAVEWLKVHDTPTVAYEATVVSGGLAILPGTTVEVMATQWRNGVEVVDLSGDALICLERTITLDTAGLRVTRLVLATKAEWAKSAAAALMENVQDFRRHLYAGWTDAVGSEEVIPGADTLDDLPLNAVLKLTRGSALPTVYALDEAGFAQAIAAAVAHDVIWVGTGTISGDHTIPANVTVASMPFSKSTFTGQLTLSDGSVLNGLEVSRSATQAGDLICLVPPASGMAYCGYCYLSAVNAQGAGYVAAGACGNLTLRSCVVLAQSAGVDSNPWSGPTAGWPTTVYAATGTLGLYRSAGSLAQGAAQPTWTTVNEGLAYTGLVAFCLDTHEAIPDTRMFCIDSTDHTLYRRTGGDWEAVLTTAAAIALGGGDGTENLISVVVDRVTGYVYALCSAIEAIGRAMVLRSIDHGTNWVAAFATSSAYKNGCGNIDADNSCVVFGLVPSLAVTAYLYYSSDDGNTFAYIDASTAEGSFSPSSRLHPGAAGVWYGALNTTGGWDLYQATTAGAYAIKFGDSDYVPVSPGALWLDPADGDHVVLSALTTADRWVESTDACATADVEEDMSVTSMREVGQESADGYWLHGCSLPGSGRAIVYVSTNGYNLTNKSGTNWNSSPYTGAIPVTCGGVIERGLWAVGAEVRQEAPYCVGCVLANTDGREEAQPEYSDRAAWRTDVDGGARHADDWTAGASHHPAVDVSSGSALIVVDGQSLVVTSGTAAAGEVLTADGDGDVGWAFPDAGVLTYTPTTLTDWDSDADPGDVDQALDQLAERVDDLETVPAEVSTINFVIDGGLAVIETGIKGDLVVDFACTITGVTVLADQSGSIIVDIWKDTYANFPPTDDDSITASAPPTLDGAAKSQDTTLTGWTTTITAGDVLRFNVDSVDLVQRVTVALRVARS